MNQTFYLWIATQTLGLILGGLGAYIVLVQRVTKLEARFEMFVSLVGTKVAKALHSPTNHLGIDALLEEYINRHHELSLEQWRQLHIMCENIMIAQEHVSHGEKAMAAFMAAVCEHKLIFRKLNFGNKK